MTTSNLDLNEKVWYGGRKITRREMIADLKRRYAAGIPEGPRLPSPRYPQRDA